MAADITHPLRRYIYKNLPVLYVYLRQHLFKDQVYGFKLLFYQIRYTRYWLRLLHALGWKLIHLRRRNTVHQALSSIIAHKSQIWRRRATEQDPTNQVSVSPESLERELRVREGWTTQELDFIGALPRLTLFYEDDLLDANTWSATIDRVTEYLGIVPFQVGSPDLKKMDDRPLEEILSNYHDLQAHLAKGKYAGLLGA